MANQADAVEVRKVADREVRIEGTFAVPREVMFEAISRPEHVKQWLGADGMTLVDAHVDGRAGGSFRYVFERQNGRKIEVRGEYRSFEPPRGFAYLESYDFSPLRIEVTTTFDEVSAGTRFTQTLRYFSTRERDEDFDGVAASSRTAFARLARYLTEMGRANKD